MPNYLTCSTTIWRKENAFRQEESTFPPRQYKGRQVRNRYQLRTGLQAARSQFSPNLTPPSCFHTWRKVFQSNTHFGGPDKSYYLGAFEKLDKIWTN